MDSIFGGPFHPLPCCEAVVQSAHQGDSLLSAPIPPATSISISFRTQGNQHHQGLKSSFQPLLLSKHRGKRFHPREQVTQAPQGTTNPSASTSCIQKPTVPSFRNVQSRRKQLRAHSTGSVHAPELRASAPEAEVAQGTKDALQQQLLHKGGEEEKGQPAASTAAVLQEHPEGPVNKRRSWNKSRKPPLTSQWWLRKSLEPHHLQMEATCRAAFIYGTSQANALLCRARELTTCKAQLWFRRGFNKTQSHLKTNTHTPPPKCAREGRASQHPSLQCTREPDLKALRVATAVPGSR